MPLKKGSSRKTISANISELTAIAIALQEARKNKGNKNGKSKRR